MKSVSILAACLLGTATLAFAQAPAQVPAGKARHDCSQAKDPKACEERHAKMKEARDKAAKACEGKQDQARRDCMRHELCAQAKDPKACEERAAKAKAAVQKARQSCEGKQAQERRDCMRQELNSQKK